MPRPVPLPVTTQKVLMYLDAVGISIERNVIARHSGVPYKYHQSESITNTAFNDSVTTTKVVGIEIELPRMVLLDTEGARS